LHSLQPSVINGLPVALCGGRLDTLRVYKNKVTKKIFGYEKDEAKGCWRKQYGEESRQMFAYRNIVSEIA
jgi:hypothetical protein